MIITLPTHLVHDILINLPVKSLMRFKCVSKSCQSIIEDSSFVELRRARSKKHPQLLIQIQDDCDYSKIILSPENAFNGGVVLHKVKIPWATQARMLNPINGLFCFPDGLNGVTCIYNHATRQVTPWAQTSVNIGVRADQGLFGLKGGWVNQQPTYGFGFDPSTNKYKVLCVWQISWPANVGYNMMPTRVWKYACEVLIVGENQWRRIDEVPQVDKLDECAGVYANGSIYYRNASATSVFEPPDTEFIVAFDVGTEKFRVIEIPDFIFDNSPGTPRSSRCRVGGGCLLQIDGHIALVDIIDKGREKEHLVKLWISDDDIYNKEKKMMKKNWTEETILLPFSFVNTTRQFLYPVEGTTEIVIRSDYSSMLRESITPPPGCISLYIYERIMKEFRKVDISGVSPDLTHPLRYELFIYHENLLPIHQKPVEEEETSEIVEMDFEYY